MRPIDEIEQEIRNILDTHIYDHKDIAHSDVVEMLERLSDDYFE